MKSSEGITLNVQTVLAMLRSRKAEKVRQAEAVLRRIGPKAAELLLAEARRSRCTTKYRLQCLRLADDIGILIDSSSCRMLQQLIEARQRDIAEEASRILVRIAPPGPFTDALLPFIARGSSGIRDRLQELKAERSSKPPRNGHGRKPERHLSEQHETETASNRRQRSTGTVRDDFGPDLERLAPAETPD